MRITKYLTISLILFIFSGCSFTSPHRYVKENEILENRYVAFQAPTINWHIFKDYKTWKKIDNQINLYNDTPKGATFTITIHTDPERRKGGKRFQKDSNYKKIFKEIFASKWRIENNKERGIKYAHKEVQYIKGMKCVSDVEAGENILKQNGSTIKSYQVWCGYYDKTQNKFEGRRNIVFMYDLRYYPGNIRLEKDKNTPTNQIIPRDKMELKLKQQVKKLIDTLKIKNFDKEKMIKEGLYHPDKKYEHMKW